MGNVDVYWRHAATGAAGHILGDHILTHILFNIMRIVVTGLFCCIIIEPDSQSTCYFIIESLFEYKVLKPTAN